MILIASRTSPTMKNTNNAWKLDLLEAKFQKSSPRFPHTKKLLAARANDKFWKRLPSSEEDANTEILALKQEYFNKKYHGSYKKLEKEVAKIFKKDLNKFGDKESKVVEFLKSPELITQLITSKLVKIITVAISIAKTSPPEYIQDEIRNILEDKSHKCHPTSFFKTYCQNDKDLNNYFSSLWNQKSIKPVLNEIEWSFRLVRGNLTKQEKDLRKRATGKDIEDVESEGESALESESESEDEDDSEPIQPDEADFEKYAIYDKLVGDSDAEDEQFELDPNTNYNEITDEEQSEPEDSDSDVSVVSTDSFFAEEPKKEKSKSKESKTKTKSKEKEFNLPKLASGYYSGGSDDEDDFDADKDNVVKEATTQRKNRRGQRARQKIWEQKYGKEAKHVQSENLRITTEREVRQKEFEERQKKRELKAALAPSGSNVEPLGERKQRPDGTYEPPKPVVEKIHPSWEAKKLAEEKYKNVKFEGKKITFD